MKIGLMGYYQGYLRKAAGKTAPGVRDGSGPYEGSFQNQLAPGVGRRQAAGEPCPVAADPAAKVAKAEAALQKAVAAVQMAQANLQAVQVEAQAQEQQGQAQAQTQPAAAVA